MDELSDVWNVRKNPYDYALYFEQDWKPANSIDVQLRTSEHRSMYSYVRLSSIEVS